MNEKETEIVNDIKNSKEVGWIKSLLSKIKGKVLLYVLIGLGILIGAWYIISGIAPSIIKETNKTNAKLELRIDSLRKDNLFLISRLYELEKSQQEQVDLINKNNQLMQENNKQLLNLKKIYNEKINSISNYNVSQLDSFFTNRYKDYYNR